MTREPDGMFFDVRMSLLFTNGSRCEDREQREMPIAAMGVDSKLAPPERSGNCTSPNIIELSRRQQAPRNLAHRRCLINSDLHLYPGLLVPLGHTQSSQDGKMPLLRSLPFLFIPVERGKDRICIWPSKPES